MLVFAPKILKEILGNLPKIILKSVNIKEVLLEATPFIIGFAKPRLSFENQQKLNIDLLPIKIRKTQDRASCSQSFTPKDGEAILELYFNQFLNPKGLVLDIRPIHFTKDNKESHQLNWDPNNTWYRFQDDFRQGLIKLYKGFYSNQDKLYTEGLYDLGLATNLDDSKIKVLKSLFRSHFGEDQSSVCFKLDTFNESFAELFKFFMENDVKIKTDFIFLGVYLITLYMHLEKLGGHYNVSRIFTKVFLCEQRS